MFRHLLIGLIVLVVADTLPAQPPRPGPGPVILPRGLGVGRPFDPPPFRATPGVAVVPFYPTWPWWAPGQNGLLYPGYWWYDGPSLMDTVPAINSGFPPPPVEATPAVQSPPLDPSRALISVSVPTGGEASIEGIASTHDGDTWQFLTPRLNNLIGETTFKVRVKWHDGSKVVERYVQVAVRPGDRANVSILN